MQDQMRYLRDLRYVPDALQSGHLRADLCGDLRGDLPDLPDKMRAKYLRTNAMRPANLPHLCNPVRHLSNAVQPENLRYL
jgi:hypothetical protein